MFFIIQIVFITNNLNTRSPTSLHKTYPPEEACRLTEQFEWHYTPKHGSWLDMAEIEIGIIRRQALGKPLPDLWKNIFYYTPYFPSNNEINSQGMNIHSPNIPHIILGKK